MKAFGWNKTGVGPLGWVSPSSKALCAGSIWYTGALANSCKSVWVNIWPVSTAQHTPVAQLTLLVVQLSQLSDAQVEEAARISINTNGRDKLNVKGEITSGGNASVQAYPAPSQVAQCVIASCCVTEE